MAVEADNISNEGQTVSTNNDSNTESNINETCRTNSRPKRALKIPMKFLDQEKNENRHEAESEEEATSCSLTAVPETVDFNSDHTDTDLCSICHKSWLEEEGDTMTFCESCQLWMHYACAGVNKDVVSQVDLFVCMHCAMKLLPDPTHPKTLKPAERSCLNGQKNDHLQQILSLTKEVAMEKKKSTEAQNELSQSIKKATLLEQDVEMKDNIVNKTKSSLEILTKKVASLEKERNQLNQKINSISFELDRVTKEKVDMESKISDLEDAIKAHEKINRDIIASAVDSADSSGVSVGCQTNTASNNCPPCESCKEKSKEITSLITRISSTESTIKEMEKVAISTNSDLYAAKATIAREQAVTNELLKLLPPSHPTNQSSGVPNDNGETNAPHHILPPSSDSETPTLEVPTLEDTTGHNHGNRSSKICRFEQTQRGSCPYSPCKFSHDVTVINTSTSPTLDICINEFLRGKHSCPDGEHCTKSHQLDFDRLKKGICIHELRSKGSCPYKLKCHFSHQIPSSLYGNTELIETVSTKVKKKNNENDTTNEVKPVCLNEFMEGSNSCQSEECRRSKGHNLDFKKIRNGICLFEFFQPGSCSHRNKCRYTHQIPEECKHNPTMIQDVLCSIKNYKNQAKITEVLGNDFIIAAEHMAYSTQIASTSSSNEHDASKHVPPSMVLTTTPPSILSNNTYEARPCNQETHPSLEITHNVPHNYQQFSESNHRNSPSPLENLTPFLTNLVKELISKEVLTSRYLVPAQLH